jgi:hypothetical protein
VAEGWEGFRGKDETGFGYHTEIMVEVRIGKRSGRGRIRKKEAPRADQEVAIPLSGERL